MLQLRSDAFLGLDVGIVWMMCLNSDEQVMKAASFATVSSRSSKDALIARIKLLRQCQKPAGWGRHSEEWILANELRRWCEARPIFQGFVSSTQTRIHAFVQDFQKASPMSRLPPHRMTPTRRQFCNRSSAANCADSTAASPTAPLGSTTSCGAKKYNLLF